MTTPFAGRVDPAFNAVDEAFRANFEPSAGRPPDLGAALCVVVDGEARARNRAEGGADVTILLPQPQDEDRLSRR